MPNLQNKFYHLRTNPQQIMTTKKNCKTTKRSEKIQLKDTQFKKKSFLLGANCEATHIEFYLKKELRLWIKRFFYIWPILYNQHCCWFSLSAFWHPKTFDKTFVPDYMRLANPEGGHKIYRGIFRPKHYNRNESFAKSERRIESERRDETFCIL